MPLLVFIILLWASAPTAAADMVSVRNKTMPDLTVTPGVVALTSKDEVCGKKWGRDARHVTPAMKRKVFAAYGLKGNKPTSWCRKDKHGRVFEVDHLISRELGGADDVKNLWAECYSGAWNAGMKDRTENRLHVEVCADHITLDQAQQDIRTDWIAVYIRYFGKP